MRWSPTMQGTAWTAYLGLGANLGDRRAQLEQALDALRAPGLQVRRVSALYASAPQGPVLDQPPFFNAVAQVETTLEPAALLRHCLRVEATLGRKRRVLKGPRNIDVDLLMMEDYVLNEPDLVVPHPELTRRAFALVPLLELWPMAVDPRDGTLLCRHAGELLLRQAIVRLGSLPSFPAGVRLPAHHIPAPAEVMPRVAVPRSAAAR
jgi:2-amino-4-hydroxy-6-hydroxymethyldihydropteridine diphosphokinase